MNTIAPPVAPKIFGPFEVLGKIGRGASADVYKVRIKTSGQIAALKVGERFQNLDPAVVKRFKQEFTAIRPLKHPNLVRALGLGEHKGFLYLLMELVPGQNLEDRLKEAGPAKIADTIAIFRQIADGVHYLHTNRILHRDIKPSNIFVTPELEAKLGDFGLLKNLQDDSNLTQSRQSLGTIEYGAPEQFEDAKRADARCDLYSLAATFYTALTGKFPFGKGGQLQILQRKLLNQFVPLRLVLPQLDPAVDQLVIRCLHPDPAQRPTSCDEFQATLRDYCEEETSNTDSSIYYIKPGSGPERRTSVRFEVDLTATFVPFHQNMRGRWDATILDVSPIGVRLQTPRPVAVNSVLHLTLGDGSRTELALVRWVRPGEGETQIAGCSFVHPLTSQEFKALYLYSTHKQLKN